jgi:hypothetical protein
MVRGYHYFDKLGGSQNPSIEEIVHFTGSEIPVERGPNVEECVDVTEAFL